MKKLDAKTNNGIASAIGHAVVGHLVLVGFGLLALPFLYFGETKKIKGMTGLAIVIFVIGIFVSKVTTKEILRRLDEDATLKFRHAVQHTLYSHLCYLCFIPILGSVFKWLFVTKPSNPFRQTDDDTNA